MDISSNNGICRCCATEGTFKDLSSTYQWMGEEEIYSEMLKECFDIHLSIPDDSEEGGICEICISQLRNASNFKKQVLHTEKQFKNRLHDTLFKDSIVKVEVPVVEDALDSDNDNNASEDFSVPELVSVKEESIEETKPKKRAARAVVSRSKKTKSEHGESSTKRALRSGAKTEHRARPIMRIKEESGTTRVLITIRTDIMAKHRRNVTAILLHSNATPIFTHTGLGYSCFYCRENFLNPSDLKKHTLETHNDDEEKKQIIPEKERLSRFYVKMDITDLKCTICNSDFDNLEQILDHFQAAHKIKIYKDIDNHCMPFKFDGDVLKCCICSTEFNKFKIILEHMNVHMRNYICEECDAGFITQRKLLTHKSCHKIGNFDCKFCPKTFDTYRKKKLHEKAVHIHFNLLHKCSFCSERFTNTKSKADHMTAEHGIKKVVVKCKACDKNFNSQNELRVHTKRDHLMERRHTCTDCDMKFYSKHELTEHKVKHSGERNFQCKVCLKSYGRRKTLNEHMRIHANDRRFKCEFCGQAFVQKCSWVGHMRSKHREHDVL